MSKASAQATDREPCLNSVAGLEGRLSDYLSMRWGRGSRVSGMTLVPGGAARATWRCSVAGAEEHPQGLIFRIDTGNQLLPTDERAEYLTMDVVHRAGFPVAAPLFYEDDRKWFGHPFSIVSEIPDCQTSPDMIKPDQRTALGSQLWQLLGKLTTLSPDTIGLQTVLPKTTRETCANEQLAYWWSIQNSAEIHPNPIASAGYRWLQRNTPPAPERLCLVHGDYRTGNYLYSPDGKIRAILDWEMAHIGDPLEDLAWSLDARQNGDRSELAGSLLPHADAVSHWQRSSGLAIDPKAFRWWQVFSAFKALAIWTLSAKKFDVDDEKRPVLARIGWLLVDRQQRILLDYISPHSRKRGYEYAP